MYHFRLINVSFSVDQCIVLCLQVTPRDQSGLRDPQVLMKVKKIAHKAIAKKVGKWGLKGEGDRFIGTKKPKHLFSGKRGIGKTDRR